MKLWGSVAMQLTGFWSFPIFFRVLHWTGNKLFTVNQAFIKNIWTNQVLKLIFPWALEQNILNKYNCSGHPANVKDSKWTGGQTKNY